VVSAGHLMLGRLWGDQWLEEGSFREVSVDMVNPRGFGVQEEAGRVISSTGRYRRFQTEACLTSDQSGTCESVISMEAAARFSGKGSGSTHDLRSKEGLAPWTGCLWSLLLTGRGSEAILIVRRECWMVWIIGAGLLVLHGHAGGNERTRTAGAAPQAAVCTGRTDTETHGEKSEGIEEMLHTRLDEA